MTLEKQKTAKLATRIRNLRHGGRVERCHGIPHLGSYSNAAHQWGVAVLLYALWPEDFARLGPLCLLHDAPEPWVGDIPAPMLRHTPGMKEMVGKIESLISNDLEVPDEHALSAEDRAKFKACDWLDFLFWCHDQLRMGNTEVREGIEELTHFIRTAGLPHPADKLFELVTTPEWMAESARAAGVIRWAVERIQREEKAA